MDNMNNQTINNNPADGGKTFTQDEVNRIVSDRLAREREKRNAELDERENALKQRELAVIAREKLEAAGLDKELCSVLRYDDEATLDAAIQHLSSIKGFKKKKEKDEKLVIPNILPDGVTYEQDDTNKELRKAMKLPEI